MDVSVVIPCYNKAPYVGEAIQSVLSQTHPDVEIIVVDDGSTDDSWSIIQSFGDNVEAIRQKNQGACRARNRGASLASGDALMFLDADDQITPPTLSGLVEALDDSEKSIAAAPWAFLKWSGSEWKQESPNQAPMPPRNDYLLGWLSGWFIPPCALLWSKEAYEVIDGWDETIQANQDGDIVLRALVEGVEIVRTSQGLGLYRDFGGTERSSLKTKETRKTILSRIRVEERIAERLSAQDQLGPYAEALGRNLHRLAQKGFSLAPDPPAAYLNRLEEVAKKARELAGVNAIEGTLTHRLLCYAFGLRRKEKLATMLAQVGIGSRIRRRSLNSPD